MTDPMGKPTQSDDLTESRHDAVHGVGIGFMVFSSVVISLRVYVRSWMLRAMGPDDWLMIVGTILTFGLSIATMIGSNYGVGKHAGAIENANYVPMLKCVWATRLFYTAGICCVKMSLLWFYLRLDPRRHMRWAVFFVMFFNIGLSLASFFGAIFACVPPDKFWDMTGKQPGHCMATSAQQKFYEVNGILNIVTDILTYLLPIPMLWQVQMSWRKKGAILGIFGLGILSIAAGGVRYNFVTRLSHAKEEYFLLLADSLNWCSIETYVAIFCGSAPSLSVLMKTYVPHVLGSSAAKYGSGQYAAGRSNALNDRSRGSRPRRLGDTQLGSQDAIVSATDGEQSGILMKTDVHLDERRKSDVGS